MTWVAHDEGEPTTVRCAPSLPPRALRTPAPRSGADEQECFYFFTPVSSLVKAGQGSILTNHAPLAGGGRRGTNGVTTNSDLT